MVAYGLTPVDMLPESVRHDFDLLQFDCRSPEDVLRLFPQAYVWNYRSAGDWGADYGQSLVIRLTDRLALSVSESFVYDNRDYSRDVEVHWLHPESKTYTVIAEWTNDEKYGSPCQDGWSQAEAPQPVSISDYWVDHMELWGNRWKLMYYGGLKLRDDSVVFEDTY